MSGWPALRSDHLVWVAGGDGVVGLSPGDGHVVVEIACAASTGALAVDAQTESVRAVCGSDLRTYTIAGDLRGSTSLRGLAGKPVLLAVDAQAGRVWVAAGATVRVLDLRGALLDTIDTGADVVALALDRRRGRAWIATAHALTAHRADGAAVLAVDVGASARLRAIDYDLEQDQAWVVADGEIVRYHADGTLAARDRDARARSAALIAADGDGGAWLACAGRLAHVGAASASSLDLTAFPSAERIVAMAADPGDRSVWVASDRRLAHYQVDGSLSLRLLPALRGRLASVGLPAPVTPPELQMLAAGTAATAFPALRLSYRGADVDPDTLAFTANGERMPAVCEAAAGSITCVPRRALADGHYDIRATIASRSGRISRPAIVQLEVGSALTAQSPRR